MTTTEVNPLAAAALVYAALGWPVVPLFTPVDGVCDCPRSYKDNNKCKPGKHPRTRNGLDDASCDEERIRRWWKMFPNANIGVDLARAGLVDIAPDSIEWFAEFTARGLPPTLRFASGGGEGHAHHLYVRPDECATYRDAHSGEYDILSNGYAVMPPSLHASGRVYTWLWPDDGAISSGPDTPSPRWAVDILNTKGRRREAPPEVEYDVDAPPVDLRGDARERWYGRLYEVNKEHGGVDRSYSLWRLAVALLEAGCTPAFTEQLIAERDRALGWTKFTNRNDRLARYRIIVARAGAGQGPGRVRVRVEPTEQRSASGEYEWLTGESMLVLEDEDLTWPVFSLVGCGLITELDGKVKQSGKTTFVASMVRCILTGEPFLGQPTTYTPVAYLTEQSSSSFRRNLKRAGLLGRADFHILLWSRTRGDDWPTIVKKVEAYMLAARARLLIVDTLGQFSGVRGDEENKSGAAMTVMEPLQEVAATGIGVLVSRHDRKSGGDTGDSGRGSSAYAGAVDIILHLQRLVSTDVGKQRQRELKSLSRFEETPDDVLIELAEEEPYAYRVVGDAVQVRDRELRTEILARLPLKEADAIDTRELEQVVIGRSIDIRRILKQLVVEREVVRVGEGLRKSPYCYYQRVFGGDADDGD